MWSKDAPADHVTLASPVEVCDGIQQYSKVHSSFKQPVVKIYVRINKQEIVKEYTADVCRVTNNTAYLTELCRQGAEENTAAISCTVSDSPMEDVLTT